MSVINQMLRDLDQRTMPADRAIYASRTARDSSRYVAWRRWAVASVVIVGGIALSVTIANWGDSSNGAVPLIAESSAAVVDVGAIRPGASAATIEPTALPLLASPAVTSAPVEAPSDPDAMLAARKSSSTASNPARAKAPGRRVGAADPMDHPVAAPSMVAALEHSQATPPLIPLIGARPETSAISAVHVDTRIIRAEAPRTANSEFRRAATLIDQGRLREAQDRLRDAIDMDARHEAARQTLAALLLEEKSYDAAEAVLAAGLLHNPAQTNFALALSRLNLERGNMPAALAVLRNHAGYALAHPEYRAFAAALYGKSGAHAEAIVEYEAALRLAPRTGTWWIGLGLANEAEDRLDAATDAYRNARATGSLSANLSEFVERKLQRKH